MSLPLAYQASCARGERGVVARLRRLQQRDGPEDVGAQERPELRARGGAVVRPDRGGDVGLVLQEPVLGRRQVGQAAGEADDRQAGPRDVVLPELAHVVVQALGLRGPRGSGVVVPGGGVVVKGGGRAARGGEGDHGGRGADRHRDAGPGRGETVHQEPPCR